MKFNNDNNKKIEVHDASIIQSNEHPNFKIGDVITNGYGNLIVKGFSRSILGLAYVLDAGDELFGEDLFCWLTEQVDAKFHLVERKQSMETNAPEKIYLEWHCIGDKKHREWVITPKTNNEPVEYIRADIFIEKAKKFIRNRVDILFKVKRFDGELLADSYIEYALARQKAADKMIEDFINYIKG